MNKDTPSINEAYSSDSWWYDLRGLFILYFAYRGTIRSQVKFFGNSIGEKHLEIAIGSGSLFKIVLLYRKFKRLPLEHIDGFDYADKMIAGAQKRLKGFKGVRLFKADASQTSLESNFYDTASIANALHSLPDIEGTIKETNRVLKVGGVFSGNCLLYPKGETLLDKLSTKINAWGMKKGILHRPYFQNEVEDLLKKNRFELLLGSTQGNCYSFSARKS